MLLYKGYKALDTDKKTELTIIEGENGLVRIIIPANYEGHIKVSFVSPVYWRAAEIFSLIAYLALFAACFKKGRREKCKNQEKC